jgi:hypothetical protein
LVQWTASTLAPGLIACALSADTSSCWYFVPTHAPRAASTPLVKTAALSSMYARIDSGPAGNSATSNRTRSHRSGVDCGQGDRGNTLPL